LPKSAPGRNDSRPPSINPVPPPSRRVPLLLFWLVLLAGLVGVLLGIPSQSPSPSASTRTDSAAAEPSQTIQPGPAGRKMPLVALDIGHSPGHPGATSARGVPEFEFNRELAAAIDMQLRDGAFRTRLINADGNIGKLAERARQSQGADAFLSIHHDSVQPQYLSTWQVAGKSRRYSDRFHGFSLFVSRKNPFPLESLRCASALGESLRRAGFEPALYHAEPIPGENRPFADRAHGVHYFDDLVVLKQARCPAVLLEAGVILNRDEETNLVRAATRIALARAVTEGLAGCLGKLDKVN
jgi:N-acetylmuramoyl-L-alanine amidase